MMMVFLKRNKVIDVVVDSSMAISEDLIDIRGLMVESFFKIFEVSGKCYSSLV